MQVLHRNSLEVVECTLDRCLRSEYLLLKCFGQCVQGNIIPSSWSLECVCRSLISVNDLWHLLQANGLSGDLLLLGVPDTIFGGRMRSPSVTVFSAKARLNGIPP